MKTVNDKVLGFNKEQLEQKELNDFIDELRNSHIDLCIRAAATIRAKDNKIIQLEAEIEDMVVQRDIIMRDISELLPIDPDHERAVCVSYDDIYRIVSEHLNLDLDV